jgi:Right handed beta helix region
MRRYVKVKVEAYVSLMPFTFNPFFTVFLLGLLHLQTAKGIDIFVSPTGDDKAAGTLEAPFATLQRARDAARSSSLPDSIILRGGRYFLPQGLTLDKADSNTTWRAWQGEQPVLVGGVQVKGWQLWKEGIYQADVSHLKGTRFTQLLFNGQRQHLARYPNFDPARPVSGGWAYVEGKQVSMYDPHPDDDPKCLRVKPADWREWAHPEDVSVFVYARYNWWNNILPVEKADAALHRLFTKTAASYAMRPGDRYFLQGALEELDAEGEWYLDPREWQLYFKPGSDLTKGVVVVPTAAEIINVMGASDIEWRGLTFECCEASALRMNMAARCRVIGSVFRSVGGYKGHGVAVFDGKECAVIGCDISYTGSNGVILSGGYAPDLSPSRHRVDNCYIHHPGVFYKEGLGVFLHGVGQQVTHCLIHDAPRMAIAFHGNLHRVEGNHIRHVALETEDVSAIYTTGRNWIGARGSVIRHNFIHDVLGFGWNGQRWQSPYLAHGIYLDDSTGGVDVLGNIVVRAASSSLYGHNARDCRVKGNIFVESGEHQWLFKGWDKDEEAWKTHLDKMQAGYESVMKMPAWKDMRGIQVHPRDVADEVGWVAKGNEFYKNIISWSQPMPKALRVTKFSPQRNAVDHNLYWHHHQPLGVYSPNRSQGQVIGKNLLPSLTAKPEPEGPASLPKGWAFDAANTSATAQLIGTEDQPFLQIKPAANDSEKSAADVEISLKTKAITLKPWGSYRLSAELRTDSTRAQPADLSLGIQHSGKADQPSFQWISSPSLLSVDQAWKTQHLSIIFPGPGRSGWLPSLAKEAFVKLSSKSGQGSLFIRKIELVEFEVDEWKSWQVEGFDQHSQISDPKFMNAEKDDYRLSPDSPAWKLGFEPIPTDRIGPYASPDRATWPILEAEGAREHPMKD